MKKLLKKSWENVKQAVRIAESYFYYHNEWVTWGINISFYCLSIYLAVYFAYSGGFDAGYNSCVLESR